MRLTWVVGWLRPRNWLGVVDLGRCRRPFTARVPCNDHGRGVRGRRAFRDVGSRLAVMGNFWGFGPGGSPFVFWRGVSIVVLFWRTPGLLPSRWSLHLSVACDRRGEAVCVVVKPSHVWNVLTKCGDSPSFQHQGAPTVSAIHLRSFWFPLVPFMLLPSP